MHLFIFLTLSTEYACKHNFTDVINLNLALKSNLIKNALAIITTLNISIHLSFA
jgi:hypothetical protein